MTKILVICGAGASSSFLVHQLRLRSAARGLDLDFSAGAIESLPAEIQTADAVLVASHLAAAFPIVSATASALAIRAILLPAVAFDAAGADTALDLFLAHPTESPSHA